MNIGDKIIAAIAEANMALNEDGFPPMWASNAAEQLEAVVEAHIEERVKAELATHFKGGAGKPIDC